MAMKIRRHKQLQTEPTVTPSQPSGRRGKFASQPPPATEPVLPNLQTQLEHAQRFGHHLGNYRISQTAFPPPVPFQPKLTIGAQGDRYEQEADRLAQQIVQRANPLEVNSELQMKPLQQMSAGAMPTSAELERNITQARGSGSGQPLSDTIRHPMEHAFGADFSRVRIHTDSQSDQMNRSIQAKAFTTGQDIFFRQGIYQPDHPSGQELLAHELTHVVQQQPQVMAKEILQAQWEPYKGRANTERWDKEINGVIWFKETLDEKVRYAPWAQPEGIKFYGDAAYDLDGNLWYSKAEWLEKWQQICSENNQEMQPLLFPDEEGTMEIPSKIEKQEEVEEVEEAIDDNYPVEHLDFPTVTSDGSPQYSPDGGYAWTVTMAIQEAQVVNCWIVQKIKLKSSDSPNMIIFWEAFPVQAGNTQALYKDIYQSHLRNKNGWTQIEGKMQAVRCEDGKVPPGLRQGEVEEADHEQFTSYKEPAWWQSGGGGTKHNLFLTLNDGQLVEEESTTVPDGGEWVRKNKYSELNFG